MNKKAIAVFIVLILLAAASGCAPKAPAAGTSGAAAVSANADPVTAGSGNNGAEVTADIGDGLSVAGGNGVTWPAADMGDLSSPGGKITGVLKDSGSGSTIVAISELSEQAAKDYYNGLPTKGYKASIEMSDDESIFFSGENSAGASVTFTYTYSSKESGISYTKAK